MYYWQLFAKQKLLREKTRITTETPVFDVEPFGHELPSGLSLRVEDKAEWLRRNEKYSLVFKRSNYAFITR